MSLKILRVDLLINGLPCLSLILDGGLLLLKSFLVHQIFTLIFFIIVLFAKLLLFLLLLTINFILIAGCLIIKLLISVLILRLKLFLHWFWPRLSLDTDLLDFHAFSFSTRLIFSSATPTWCRMTNRLGKAAVFGAVGHRLLPGVFP